MYSLRKFAGRTGKIGQPLPDIYPTFAMERIAFRQGATSMIAGRPGSFKSVLALNMMTYWASCGKTVLYLSADSDEFTVAKRVGGILTGQTTEQVEYDFMHGKSESYADKMRCLEGVEFIYTSADIEGVQKSLKTFEAIYGDWPDVVFVDNLINYADNAADWAGMLEFTKQADILAREMSSHICILHHAKVDRDSAGKPPADWEIQGRVTQIPRLVLTVAANGMALYLACVKNTNGPQFPMAENFSQFQVQPSMKVTDASYAMEARR